MRVIKKIFKVIGIILLIILILIALAALSGAIYHQVKLKSNREFMTEKGYYNLVSAGDHALNLISYGGNADGCTFIALGGAGSGFPMEIRQLVNELKSEGTVYYLARPGYDGSEDTKDDMTVPATVEDYRAALKNAGIEGPCVVLAHSLAGVYAADWVNRYPEDFEKLVLMDATPVMEVPEEGIREAQTEVSSGAWVMRTAMTLGLGDVAPRMLFPDYQEEYDYYSADDMRISDAMAIMTMGSRAFYSGMMNTPAGMNEVWNGLTPNDVPKLYINVENGYHSVEEMEQADALSEYTINSMTEDFTGSEEERRHQAYVQSYEDMQEYISLRLDKLAEKLGSCEIVDFPGDHFDFYMGSYKGCAEIIKDFLN